MTKITLNVNEQARKDANLRLLKRSVDRSITDILGGATHVVLYNFSQETQSWEKSNVEGSLSLAVRGGDNGNDNRFILVILNRNSPENYPMELTSDFQLQQNDPYLIFKNYEQEEDNLGNNIKGPATIRGIWFPNDEERMKMNDLLVDVLQSLKNNPGPAAAPAAAPAPAPANDNTIHRNAATASLFAALNIGTSPEPQKRQQETQNYQTKAVSAASRSSSTSTASTNSNQQQQPTLDKKSLQLALLSLIQDERFLDLLHAQYLKVHNARANRK